MQTTDKFIPDHLEPWTRPECYIGAQWQGWFVFLGQNRDSDCLTRSNFQFGFAAVKRVQNKDLICDEDEMSSVQVISENHWAVGWVEWIAIHESDTAALKEADRIMEKLDGYPVVDETHWSQLETEESDQVWRDCYTPRRRIEYIRENRSQFEFSSLSDLLGCVRGKYFAGYASELLS